MRKFRIPLRVVFYKEDDAWIAHCLEFDLAGDGETREDAYSSLGEAIAIQVDETLRSGNYDNLFFPADGKIVQMFAAGKDVTVSEMTLKFEELVIQHTETREFSEPSSDLVTA